MRRLKTFLGASLVLNVLLVGIFLAGLLAPRAALTRLLGLASTTSVIVPTATPDPRLTIFLGDWTTVHGGAYTTDDSMHISADGFAEETGACRSDGATGVAQVCVTMELKLDLQSDGDIIATVTRLVFTPEVAQVPGDPEIKDSFL